MKISMLSPHFNIHRGMFVEAVLRTCSADAELFMNNLERGVFDKDELITHREEGHACSLLMYLLETGRICLAPYLIRKGCAIDTNVFSRHWKGCRFNTMGYAVTKDYADVVVALVQRGISCTEHCYKDWTRGPDDHALRLDAVQFAITCNRSSSVEDCALLNRMLDAAQLPAHTLTEYLKWLPSEHLTRASVLNKAIANARAQEPYFALRWIAGELRKEWLDIIPNIMLPRMKRPRLLWESPQDAWERTRGPADRDVDDPNARPNKIQKI